MITLLYILCAAAMIHYVYERIILPSFRLHFRNELFIIRDKVREIIINSKNNHEKLEAAKLLHTMLNNNINRLHLLTITNIVRINKAIADNAELLNEIETKIAKLEKDDEVLALLKEADAINSKVFTVNSLLAMLWLIPFVLVFTIFKKVLKKVLGFSTKLAKEAIIAMSEKEVEQLRA